MDGQTASGFWVPSMRNVLLHELKLRAFWLGLQAFQDAILDSNVAFVRHCLCFSYLRNQGDTLSLACAS